MRHAGMGGAPSASAELGRQRSIGAKAAPAAPELRLGSIYVSVARDGVPRGDANIARLLGVRGLHSLKTLRAGGMAGCWRPSGMNGSSRYSSSLANQAFTSKA